MKKILLIVGVLSSILLAEDINTKHIESDTFEIENAYIGLGGSISNADEQFVHCRISAKGMIGYTFNDYISVETRYDYGMNQDYTNLGIFLKPTYKGFYGLVGYGQTEYKEIDTKYKGAKVGLGYGFFDGFVNIDIVHNCEENDQMITLSHIYKF